MKWFHDRSVSAKLIAAFAFGAALTALVGIVGLSDMARINQMGNEMYEKELMGISYIKEANIQLVALGRATRGVLLASTPEQQRTAAQRASEYRAGVKANIDRARPLLYTDDGKQLIAEIDRAWSDFEQVDLRIHEMAGTEDLQSRRASVDLALGEGLRKADVVDELMTRLKEQKQETAAAVAKSTDEVYFSSRRMLIALILIAVAAGLSLGYFLSRSIAGPLGRVVWMIDEMGRCHLGHRLRMDRKDEIGRVAASMDEFAENLQHHVVGVLQQYAQGDLSTTVKASDSADELAPAMNSIQSSISELVRATGELAAAAQAGRLEVRAEAARLPRQLPRSSAGPERHAGRRGRAGQRGVVGAGAAGRAGPHRTHDGQLQRRL